MKANKLFLVILVICFVTSCKTTKEVTKSSAEVKTAADLTVNQSSVASLDISNNLSKVETNFGKVEETDNGTVEELVEETTTNTKFSKPDSTGAQYPEQTTTTKKTTRRGEHKNLKTDTESKTKAETKAQASDKSDYKSEASVKDKSKADTKSKVDDKKTNETETPCIVNWSIVLLVFGLLVVIYLVLKHYGVIK